MISLIENKRDCDLHLNNIKGKGYNVIILDAITLADSFSLDGFMRQRVILCESLLQT